MNEEIKRLSDNVKRIEENRILYKRYTADLQKLKAQEEKETDPIQRRDLYYRRAAKEIALEELRHDSQSILGAAREEIRKLDEELEAMAADSKQETKAA